MRPSLSLLIAAAAAASLCACGTAASRGGHVPGQVLAIYSSLPLQGPHREQARSILNAEKLALKEAGSRAGRYRLTFVSLEDSTPGDARAAGWDPGRVADNASSAAEDSRSIAYVGDFDSAASANSIPITNEAGFIQISPASTAVGLTKPLPGADKGEPDKYYPSGDRTFVRLVPADDVQAAGAARWAKAMGVRRAAVVDDKTLWSEGLGDEVVIAFRRAGITVVQQKGIDPRSGGYRDFARSLAGRGPDLVYFTGSPENNALRLWEDLHDAMPRLRLMGSDKLLVPGFYARVGSAGPVTYLTSVAEDLSRLPEKGRQFVQKYRREFNDDPDQYAAYGYTAISIVLAAIREAGKDANRRDAVVDEIFSRARYDSVVGPFSVQPSGDTTIDRITGYRVRNGRLAFAVSLAGR